MPRREREKFTVVVQDAGGTDVPVIHRLRSWLKSGLRAHRLRCVSIVEQKPGANQQPQEPPR